MRDTDRQDDKTPSFRPDRVFHTDDGWYVDTREGERGPFPDRNLALRDARNYVRRCAGTSIHSL